MNKLSSHLTVPSSMMSVDVDSLERVVKSLPSLLSLTFNGSWLNAWDVFERCLASQPRIRSLSFGPATNVTVFEPRSPTKAHTTLVPLHEFSWMKAFWREVDNQRYNRYWQKKDLQDVFAKESAFLSSYLLRINGSVRKLALSMESTQVSSMAALPWSALQDLSIRGRYLDLAQAKSLPTLLSSLSHMRRLSVTICRKAEVGRAPILARHPAPSTVMHGLRSLTVAFPDPGDDIFAIDTTDLLHLSLRDNPRYYHRFNKHVPYCRFWDMPILTSSECLIILRRMSCPRLTSLELVYLADPAGSDDELLEYVVEAYPNLSHLELHRYRADRTETVDHVGSWCSQVVRTHTHTHALFSSDPHCSPRCSPAISPHRLSQPGLP